MYFPYFRGKQYELITIRENAERMAKAGFVPVIEPVKENLGGLGRALNAICKAGGKAVVVVNPRYGELSSNGWNISYLLKEKYIGRTNIAAGVLLTEHMSVEDALQCCKQHSCHELTLLHAGFAQEKSFAELFGNEFRCSRHMFVGEGGKIYRKQFTGAERIFIKDGFVRRRKNGDYGELEPYSDLHASYKEEGFDGFGDFLTVGDSFSEGGGPAYVVAIHLTFINKGDGVMYVHHFKSKSNENQNDPGKKFMEALNSLIQAVNHPSSQILESDAVKEFRSLHARKHFPGLGVVKKISMQHHIETIENYLAGC